MTSTSSPVPTGSLDSPLATNSPGDALAGTLDDAQPLSLTMAAYLNAVLDIKANPNPTRITSDEDAIAIAFAASLRADCTRRQVGAAIFDSYGRCVRTGRNGAPSGYPGCLSAGACPRGQMSKEQIAPGSSYRGGTVKCIALHAEKNALLFTSPDQRRGGFMAVTDAPCDDCSLDLAGSGLARVIWPERVGGSWVKRERLLGSGNPIGGLYG